MNHKKNFGLHHIACLNGCRMYKDIMTGEYCRQFRFQFSLAFIGRAVYPVGGVKERMGIGEIVNLARYRVHFIIEHENLVYYLSNNKTTYLYLKLPIFFLKYDAVLIHKISLEPTDACVSRNCSGCVLWILVFVHWYCSIFITLQLRILLKQGRFFQ